jgi:5-methyltetrahydropteroyltriglutamate--homocysteine methyltransferase
MVMTYDVGSIPFFGDFVRFTNGSKSQTLSDLLHPTCYIPDKKYFENKIIDGFIDKVKSGLSAPNYPQFRDMTAMFLNHINGITKTHDGYQITDKISILEEQLIIPEIAVIRQKAREIHEKTGDAFKLKICVTGPYTLGSFFEGADSLFIDFARVIAKFIASNVFREKNGEVVLVAVDEPLFSLIDDPTLDYGQEGRQNLLKAWELVFHEVKSRDIQSILHLHNTANDLFWDVKSLDIIESHTNDPLYSSSNTTTRLERLDKLLKASICITDFDLLIRKTLASQGITSETLMGQHIANTWNEIKNGGVDPLLFLETTGVIWDRLKKIVNEYGDRICFAGPECGLHSFPTYESALECLRRVATVSQQTVN